MKTVNQFVHSTGAANNRFLVFEDSHGDHLRCIIEAPRIFHDTKDAERWFKAEFKGKTEFIS